MPGILIVDMAGVTVADDSSMIHSNLGPIQIRDMAPVTLGTGNDMPPWFVVGMADGTGQVRSVVIKYCGKPTGIVMAEVAFGCGSYMVDGLVIAMAAVTRPLHFVMIRSKNHRPGTGPRQVASTTTAAAENMVQGFVVAVARVTAQGCGVVIENGCLPRGIAVASIALCCGNDVICRRVTAMAAAAGPLHFVVIRSSNCRPGTGPLCVASATSAAAGNMVEGLVVAVASGTSLGRCVVIENSSLPGGSAVANIALGCGNDVIGWFITTMAVAARPLHFVVIRPENCRPGAGTL